MVSKRLVVMRPIGSGERKGWGESKVSEMKWVVEGDELKRGGGKPIDGASIHHQQ